MTAPLEWLVERVARRVNHAWASEGPEGIARYILADPALVALIEVAEAADGLGGGLVVDEQEWNVHYEDGGELCAALARLRACREGK